MTDTLSSGRPAQKQPDAVTEDTYAQLPSASVNSGGAANKSTEPNEMREAQRLRKRRLSGKRARRKRMERAKVLLRRLLTILGGAVCRDCKHTGNKGNPLTIEHVDGRNYNLRDLRYDARVDRYWKEYGSGVRLAVLCRRCNVSAQHEQRNNIEHAKFGSGPTDEGCPF